MRCNETVPDQCVKTQLVSFQNTFQCGRRKCKTCRSYGFVGILRFFGLGKNIRLFRQVLVSVKPSDIFSGLLDHFIRNTRGIRTHISDQTYMPLFRKLDAFIEFLRKKHGFLGSEVQFIDSILLHSGRRIRRLRLALLLCLCYGNYIRILIPDACCCFFCFFFIVKLCRFSADLCQLCVKRIPFRSRIDTFDCPVFFLFEGAYFFLAFADQTRCHRLHSSCRKAAVYLLPEPGRKLVADQPVKDAAGLLRIDTVQINRSRMLNGFLDGRSRDFVECNSYIIFRIHIKKLR